MIVVVVMMISPTKKEGKFGFRCSDDKSTVEIYNKINEKICLWSNIKERNKIEEYYRNNNIYCLSFKKSVWESAPNNRCMDLIKTSNKKDNKPNHKQN